MGRMLVLVLVFALLAGVVAELLQLRLWAVVVFVVAAAVVGLVLHRVLWRRLGGSAPRGGIR